jgi:hypothetical protein
MQAALKGGTLPDDLEPGGEGIQQLSPIAASVRQSRDLFE